MIIVFYSTNINNFQLAFPPVFYYMVCHRLMFEIIISLNMLLHSAVLCTGIPIHEEEQPQVCALSIFGIKGASSGKCREEVFRKVPELFGRVVFQWIALG